MNDPFEKWWASNHRPGFGRALAHAAWSAGYAAGAADVREAAVWVMLNIGRSR